MTGTHSADIFWKTRFRVNGWAVWSANFSGDFRSPRAPRTDIGLLSIRALCFRNRVKIEGVTLLNALHEIARRALKDPKMVITWPNLNIFSWDQFYSIDRPRSCIISD